MFNNFFSLITEEDSTYKSALMHPSGDETGKLLLVILGRIACK